MPHEPKVFGANVQIIVYAKDESEAYDKIDRLLSASDDVQHARVKAICGGQGKMKIPLAERLIFMALRVAVILTLYGHLQDVTVGGAWARLVMAFLAITGLQSLTSSVSKFGRTHRGDVSACAERAKRLLTGQTVRL